MLALTRGLTPEALAAIAGLESRVVAADGGRLKLEWGSLRSRTGDLVEDVLWWQGDQLLGFAGMYSFGPDVEVAGMVDPVARRRGIGSALLGAVLERARERGRESVLLVVPRTSVGGERLAVKHGGRLDHSEHALELRTDPTPPAPGTKVLPVHLREATIDDVPALSVLLEGAFGHPDGGLAERLHRPKERTWVVCDDEDGKAVGTLHLTRDEDNAAGVYGFAIDPALQGRGIGRQVLGQTCQRLREEGLGRIHLEVATNNDRALGLYTSLGFSPVMTEDYFQIPTGALVSRRVEALPRL